MEIQKPVMYGAALWYEPDNLDAVMAILMESAERATLCEEPKWFLFPHTKDKPYGHVGWKAMAKLKPGEFIVRCWPRVEVDAFGEIRDAVVTDETLPALLASGKFSKVMRGSVTL